MFRFLPLLLLAQAASANPSAENPLETLRRHVWIHGAADCAGNQDPPLEVFRYDATTYILRQNKCLNFEAPFIYVLLGTHTALVLDTGATPEPERFPVYATVRELIAAHQHSAGGEYRVRVMHSHSHSDHTAADAQFRDRPGVTLVEPERAAVRAHFGFTDWPQGVAQINLGGRSLSVLPTPGHQAESLALHDPQTGWLLTGDTLYPGRLYVWDWAAYRASLRRLAEFSAAHRITAVMGAHIEMSHAPGRLFPPGASHQLGEAPLPLPAEALLRLHQSLEQAGEKPREIASSEFSVVPVGWFPRLLSRVFRVLGLR